MQVKISGLNFNKTISWLSKKAKLNLDASLKKAGEDGVAYFAEVTPIGETGDTSRMWKYRVTKTGRGMYNLIWYNAAHPEAGIPIPILLEYGHGTGTGGYVPGRHFLSPASSKAFNNAKNILGKEVTK